MPAKKDPLSLPRFVGNKLSSENASWQFSGEVAEHFDEHISKSVPLYHEGHRLICRLSDFFIKPDSLSYEIGCSTGALTLALARHNQNKPEARFVGIDIKPDMVAKARQNLAREDRQQQGKISFVCADILDSELEPTDMIACYYTLQFIPPAVRQLLVDKLYQALNWGGGLLLFEKTRAPDARFQDILSATYTDYKLDMGYSSEEIIAKGRSLKGVLEPFSTQGNIDLLRRAGFEDVVTVHKYICFEGFLAIK